jgi:hypothetical protein
MIDDDPAKYTVEMLRNWKAVKEKETEIMLTRGVAPDFNGPPLVVSEPVRLGMRLHVRLGDGTELPVVYLPGPDPDPDATKYFTGFVFRVIVRPVQTVQPTFIQGIGIDVLRAEPIPPYQPLMGVYPTRFSLFVLPFDDPKVAGVTRFMAERFYIPKGNALFEELPFQPLGLDPDLPEFIDCRLWPRNPVMFTLRVFAILSFGTTIREQDLIGSVRLIVPERS